MSLLLISQAYAASDASFDDDFELTALECSTVLCNSNKDKNLPSSAQNEIETTSASQNVRAQKSKTVRDNFKAKAKPVRYSSDGDRSRIQTKSKRRKGICKNIRNKISLTLFSNQPLKSKASEKNEVASQMNCLKNGNEIEKISYFKPKDDSTTVFGNGFLHRPTFSDLVNCTETASQNKFPCNKRSKVCKDLKGLQKHQTTHKKIGESFPCVKCDCYFRSQNELEIHEKLVHKEEASKSTDVISSLNVTKVVRERRGTAAATKNADIENHCEKRSVKTSSNHEILNETRKLDHPYLKRPIVRVKRCDDVVQLYLNQEAADSKKIVQRDTTTSSTVKPVECPVKKPFQCATCTKSFARKNYLQKHQRTHTVEKRFKCITCDKSFKLRQTLLTHQRTHTGEKPFECVTCAKLFAAKKTLVNHQRTHTGEKPFKCVTCAKSFAEKRTMKRHQRTHTGEKPFKCGTCTDSFARKDTLLIHQRKHN